MRIARAVFTWVVILGLAFVVYRYVIPLFKPTKKETDIQTTQVRRGDLRLVVPADGTIVPRVLVEVKSKASGVVEELKIEPGDEVKKGDVLCKLDDKVVLARLRQAEVDLESAKAQLKLTQRSLSPQQKASAESAVRQAQLNRDEAQATYDRIKSLYDKGYATDDELIKAKQALDSAEESLRQAEEQLKLDLAGPQPEELELARLRVERTQADVDNAKEELGYTTITSPLNGTVLTRQVEIGTAVASGTSGMNSGTVVATIGDLSTLYVKAYIEETDLGKVSPGLPCRITTDAFTGWVWRGRLLKVYPQGETDSNSAFGGSSGARFQTEIAIDLESAKADKEDSQAGARKVGGNGVRVMGGGAVIIGMGGRGGQAAQGKRPGQGKPGETLQGTRPLLRPELSTSVDIVLEDHPAVLMLPAQYIQYDKDKPYCQVLPDPKDQKQRERRELTLGFTDGLRYEVKDGLKEGETVIIERPIKQEQQRRF
jgi:HlyD family secretion protein